MPASITPFKPAIKLDLAVNCLIPEYNIASLTPASFAFFPAK